MLNMSACLAFGAELWGLGSVQYFNHDLWLHIQKLILKINNDQMVNLITSNDINMGNHATLLHENMGFVG